MKYEFNNKEHLHLLDGKPLTGTSSVGNVLAKPLTWWASGLAVSKLGWIKKADTRKSTKQEVEENKIARQESAELWREKIWTMTPEDYLNLLDEAYKAHSVKLKDSAEAGTDLHAELERYIKHVMKGGAEEFDPKIQPFIDWARVNVKRFIASEAHCYDEELWVGGITDCVAELNDGALAIIDFKSSKEAYDSQFIQLAGYAIQVEKNGLFSEDGEHSKKLEGTIGALIVVPFGATKIEPVARLDVENCKTAFRSAVALYRFLGLTK